MLVANEDLAQITTSANVKKDTLEQSVSKPHVSQRLCLISLCVQGKEHVSTMTLASVKKDISVVLVNSSHVLVLITETNPSAAPLDLVWSWISVIAQQDISEQIVR